MHAAVTPADGLPAAFPSNSTRPILRQARVLRDICLSPEMSETGRTVPDMNEPPSRHDVTLTVERDGNSRPDPDAFTEAANRAAWSRSASIISAHLADRIINIVTVIAPNRYAAVAVARAVVSDALKRQAPSSIRPAARRAQQPL